MGVPRGVMNYKPALRETELQVGQNFAFKEPIIPGAVAPVGPPGGKATTQLLAGDRGSQWVSCAKAGMEKLPPSLPKMVYMRGGGGEDEDPAWRVPPYLAPQGESRAETGLTGGRGPRGGWRALEAQFWAWGWGA